MWLSFPVAAGSSAAGEKSPKRQARRSRAGPSAPAVHLRPAEQWP
jgi:hypothetical protein